MAADDEEEIRGNPQPEGARVTETTKKRPRYRSGFLARYVRQFVLAKMDAEGWRQQSVADWLGIPDHALSEYLNRRTHPSPDRRATLFRLGCEKHELARAELLDKLEWWMDTNELSPNQMRNCLHQIQAYRYVLRKNRSATATTPVNVTDRSRV